MRFLLLPCSSSPSHLLKCLAIAEELRARGHEFLIGAGRRHTSLLQRIGFRAFVVIGDIQEADGAGLPTVEWFRRPDPIRRVIQEEVELIERYKPHRVLGVFRFTAAMSCRKSGVPYDSLISGCMLPYCPEVLGFAEGEPGIETQAQNLRGFYRYAAIKLSRAAFPDDPDTLTDMRSVLIGERTFLWDFPQFLPLPPAKGVIHVGPVLSGRWPGSDGVKGFSDGKKTAIVSFGTCVGSPRAAVRIGRVLLSMGYSVVLAAGDQPGLAAVHMDGSFNNCTTSLSSLLERAALVVSHGGQMTVFESLQSQVPVVVMPFQPEQAHSGVCLQRIGCGVPIIPAQPFRGNVAVYLRALDAMTDAQITQKIRDLVEDPAVPGRLAAIGKELRRYRGPEKVAELLEAS